MPLKEWLPLNRRNAITKQTEKQTSIVLLTPRACMIQPEANPPRRPPPPISIMLTPRSWWASVATDRLWTQLGSQSKMAHMPISIVPKSTEPLQRLERYWGERKFPGAAGAFVARPFVPGDFALGA